MLFDASNASTGSSAKLSSPFVDIPSGKSCLEFYYNANGIIFIMNLKPIELLYIHLLKRFKCQ